MADRSENTHSNDVYAPLPITSKVGHSINKPGNEYRFHSKEPGRVGSDRSSARFSSGVDPKESITPGSVYLHRG